MWKILQIPTRYHKPLQEEEETTSNSPFLCPSCGKHFKQQRDLKRHVERKHNNKREVGKSLSNSRSTHEVSYITLCYDLFV